MKAYYNKFEVTILDFHETYSPQGTCCRYALCYFPELDSSEKILVSEIEIH